MSKVWMPVVYSTFVEDQTHNDTYLLITLGGTQLEIGSDPSSDGKTVNLPSDLRLCRLVEAEAVDMPDGPGWWAFEGRYGRNTVPIKRVWEVTEIRRDTILVGVDRVLFLDECVGKWWKLTMPWEANNE